MSTADSTSSSSFWKSPVKVFLFSWLLAGTMDIVAACINSYIVRGTDIFTRAKKILQGIAGVVLGKENVAGGGLKIYASGLAIHYIIVFCFALGYFLVSPAIPFLRRQKIIAGLLYGIFVWALMNLLVLKIVIPTYSLQNLKLQTSLVDAGILMVCIGLPIALIQGKYYDLKKGRKV